MCVMEKDSVCVRSRSRERECVCVKDTEGVMEREIERERRERERERKRERERERERRVLLSDQYSNLFLSIKTETMQKILTVIFLLNKKNKNRK